MSCAGRQLPPRSPVKRHADLFEPEHGSRASSTASCPRRRHHVRVVDPKVVHQRPVLVVVVVVRVRGRWARGAVVDLGDGGLLGREERQRVRLEVRGWLCTRRDATGTGRSGSTGEQASWEPMPDDDQS